MSLMLPAFTPPKETSHAVSHSSFLWFVFCIVFVLSLCGCRVATPKGNCLSARNKGKASDLGLHFSELIVRDNAHH